MTDKYTLKALPGKFSGLHLLATMYTAYRQIDPTMDTGADFGAEYTAALNLQKQSAASRSRSTRPDAGHFVLAWFGFCDARRASSARAEALCTYFWAGSKLLNQIR